MMDVTNIVLNFHDLLVATAKSMSTINLYRGSDEWDDLVEYEFNILVVRYIYEKFEIAIDRLYESWEEGGHEHEIIVSVRSDADLMIGRSKRENQFDFKEISTGVNGSIFTFVGFWNPIYEDSNLDGLSYVEGLDRAGNVVCAKIVDCRFLIETG